MSYQTLVQASQNLENDYGDDEFDFWEGSPFAWIREHKSATIGAIGRRLATRIFSDLSIGVNRTGRYLRVGNQLIAVKLSMEWEGGGFVFEQIKDQDYAYLFCLGLRPEAACGWLLPKTALITNGVWIEEDGLKPQHTGALATETAWLSINPDAPHQWLGNYGGTIEQVEQQILQQFAT